MPPSPEKPNQQPGEAPKISPLERANIAKQRFLDKLDEAKEGKLTQDELRKWFSWSPGALLEHIGRDKMIEFGLGDLLHKAEAEMQEHQAIDRTYNSLNIPRQFGRMSSSAAERIQEENRRKLIHEDEMEAMRRAALEKERAQAEAAQAPEAESIPPVEDLPLFHKD